MARNFFFLCVSTSKKSSFFSLFFFAFPPFSLQNSELVSVSVPDFLDILFNFSSFLRFNLKLGKTLKIYKILSCFSFLNNFSDAFGKIFEILLARKRLCKILLIFKGLTFGQIRMKRKI